MMAEEGELQQESKNEAQGDLAFCSLSLSLTYYFSTPCRGDSNSEGVEDG